MATMRTPFKAYLLIISEQRTTSQFLMLSLSSFSEPYLPNSEVYKVVYVLEHLHSQLEELRLQSQESLSL